MQRSAASSSAHFSIGLVAKRIFVVALVLANVLVFAVLFYLNGLKTAVGEIERIPESALPALVTPADRVEGPIYLLLVGSDTRENLTSLEFFGEFDGERADVIMLFRIDPELQTAQLVREPLP